LHISLVDAPKTLDPLKLGGRATRDGRQSAVARLSAPLPGHWDDPGRRPWHCHPDGHLIRL